MSELKALDELRKLVRGNSIASNVAKGIRSIADEIQAEIAERYMELPVDADGAPIHVGDTVEFGENRNQGIVKALNERMVISMHVDDDYTNYAKYGLLWNAGACRHIKPRTIEDVLRDAMEKVAEHDMANGTLDEMALRYADEIRELMGGDA